MSETPNSPPVAQDGGRTGGAVNCVVCDHPIVRQVRWLGGRAYCERHYARARTGSRGTWIATGALVAGLVLVALFMLAVGSSISDALGKNALVLVGLFLAIVPVLLWLGVFYLQDRLEPEPLTYVLGVLVLGALLAGTIGEPLRRGFFELQRWQPENAAYSIVVHALIQGGIQALLVFLAVRFTVFLAGEFDERADGIVYGTAAGLGIATLLNFNYVLDHRGLQLDVGTSRIIVAALVQAALGGLIGYALGQVKFERHAPYYVAVFVAAAAVLNGVFAWLETAVTTQDLGYKAWEGVGVAAIYAVVILGLIFYLVRRDVQETLALGGRPVAAGAED
jgi:RsiW-degrading membrane proteinase PrsW (M82 family)